MISTTPYEIASRLIGCQYATALKTLPQNGFYQEDRRLRRTGDTGFARWWYGRHEARYGYTIEFKWNERVPGIATPGTVVSVAEIAPIPVNPGNSIIRRK